MIGYFEKNVHSKKTRNASNLLKLPKIKLEVARGSFFYMGAKLYNELPLDTRKSCSFNDFKRKIKSNIF